jgi:hypothetical protein
MAHEYLIEFDIMEGHNPQTGATLTEELLQKSGWRSIGSPSGGQFVNNTGVPLTAIYIKTNNSGDTFKITADSAGRLFNTVWLKDDRTEAYFKDGNIPVSDGSNPNVGVFWMRVPRNSSTDISKCDNQGICPFTGQLFKDSPADPGPGWTKVKSSHDALDGKWKALISACPSDFREIDVYGESPDGKHVAFISRGELFLFDADKKTVAVLTKRHTALSTVNHIDVTPGKIVLSRNGQVVQSITAEKAVLRVLGRA